MLKAVNEEVRSMFFLAVQRVLIVYCFSLKNQTVLRKCAFENTIKDECNNLGNYLAFLGAKMPEISYNLCSDKVCHDGRGNP